MYDAAGSACKESNGAGRQAIARGFAGSDDSRDDQFLSGDVTSKEDFGRAPSYA
jgi:hypothetical protein